MEIIIAGVATFISAIATVIAAWKQKKKELDQIQFLKELFSYRKDIDHKINYNIFGPPLMATDRDKGANSEKENMDVKDLSLSENDLSNIILKSISVKPPLQKELVEKEIETRIESFRERLEQIEKKVPHANINERFAFIDNAILATKLEALENRLSRLESEIISKWEVTKIVFSVMTMIGALVGLSIALLQYLA